MCRSITDHVKSAPPVVKEPKELLTSLIAKLKDPSKLASVRPLASMNGLFDPLVLEWCR